MDEQKSVDPMDWAIHEVLQPHPDQERIDFESAELLRMELRECPQCNRKFVSTIERCPWCEGV